MQSEQTLYRQLATQADGGDWAGSEVSHTGLAARRERLAALDGLRALAVLTVLLSHLSGRNQTLHHSLDFLGIGHVGVYLFFVLSAFLLGLGMIESGIHGRSVRHFYVRRILRIVPLYFLVIGAVFAWQQLTGNVADDYLHVDHGWTGFAQHVAMYRGDGLFWSVVAEMQFYVVVPVLVWLLIRFRRAGLVGLMCAGLINEVLYVAAFLAPDWPNPLPWLSPNARTHGTYLGLFACGLAAAYLVHFHRGELLRMAPRLHTVATFAFAGLSLLTVVLVSRDFLGFDRPYYNLRFISPVYAVVFSAFIVSVFLGNPNCGWLRADALRLWGVFGFSIYLLHMPVIALVNGTGIAPAAKACLSIIAVLCIGALSYFAVERPFVRLSHRITRRGAPGFARLQSATSGTR